ncbi:MAG: hypothetical protein ABIY50_03925 [Ignavibacteria bacterium]
MNQKEKTLFSLFQKLDYRDRENSGKKKLTGILIAYLFSNLVMSYNFYLAFDERSFIILTLTSNLFLIAMIVLSDFDNLFLAGNTYDALAALPIKSSRIFIVKFLSAIFFLLLFIISASIPQLIFFFLIDHSLIKTAAYILVNLLFCYFSVAVLIFIYVLVLSHFSKKAGLILTVIQIIFFAFVFYSTTISSKLAPAGKEIYSRLNIIDVGVVKYLPQAFFSNAVYNPLYFLLTAMITAAAIIFLPVYISKNYISLLSKIGALKKDGFRKNGRCFTIINELIEKYLLSDNYERASYDLVSAQLRNSKFLRIKYMPMVLMPVLIVIIGLITDLPSLIFINNPMNDAAIFKESMLIISPSITLTLIMSSRILISNTKILDEGSVDTGWIFNSLPAKDGSSIIKGTYKFIYIKFLLPVITILFILLLYGADLTTVFLNITFISSAIFLISSVSLRFDKTYPFTLESTKFNSASKFIEIILSMLLGIILFLLQIFVFQNSIFVILSTTIFIVTSILLNRK